ncbi:MAG: cell division topological specificity factor MinE [Anaerolineae bacterium]|jgi:cell division topological specificity factor|nr:cell division topological specificity factor MinE [Anaerolineae bacterium]
MNWFERLLGKKEKSGATAKQRLQMVLIHDRADVSPGLLEQIKDDIIEVIAKRLEINPDTVVVNLDNTTKESRLVAEIPLLQNGRRRAAVQ